ncbi:hypothetical protein P3102_22595 [Amycolatopsis sp. QT-25]|uniref:hypothetical protein n=1 Tax=Amycolatopsis sp. QT-25 TaxID=3034022 RepID=UPI0023ED70FE|nr:hypothetical protein [Amycolatopsis sp. QT-25]WET76895.1 hypothetical protein P3102_22595 [Amycolatopsis sp. QT-25]
MSPLPPVPLDVAELVVRSLRAQLATVTDPAAARVKVSTETGRGHDGGPPSLPWVLVAEDGHGWDWPAIQRTVIRLTCWHRDTHTAKRLAGIALGLLCTPTATGALFQGEPVAAPIAGIDPYTAGPLATTTATVRARTPT